MNLDDLDFAIEKTVEGLGFELWGQESNRGRNQLQIKIFIDKPEGIKVEDCELVWRQLNDLLRVDGLFGSDFSLEVSSPGVDRKFFKFEQYKKFIGCQINIRLKTLVDDARNMRAKIVDASSETLYLEKEGTEFQISFENIEKAHLIGELSI